MADKKRYKEAERLIDAGDLVGGERILAEITKDDPLDHKAINLLGYTLYMQKRFDEALVEFRRANALVPKNPAYLYNVGTTLIDLDRVSEAQEALFRSLTEDPKRARSWYNLACLYASTSDTDKALMALKEAVKYDKKYARDAPDDEDLKSLRGNEEFVRITEAAGEKEA